MEDQRLKKTQSDHSRDRDMGIQIMQRGKQSTEKKDRWER